MSPNKVAGGPVKTAQAEQQSHSQNTTTQAQIKSMDKLYGQRQQFTHAGAIDALRSIGFEHLDKVSLGGDGRIPARGKGPSNTSAAYSFSPDLQALHWHEFSTGDKGTLFANKQAEFDPEESARLFAQAKLAKGKAKADKLVLQGAATKRAQNLYRSCLLDGTHDYINRKGLSGLHGARLDPSTGALIVPMWVSGIGLVNVQRIFPNGDKRFLKGGRTKGAYSVIGSLDGAVEILVCEGWATGAALYEETGTPVVVAFSADNLSAVCQSLRAQFLNIEVVVCGDDDRHSHSNKGRIKAKEAAEQIGAKVIFPDLCAKCSCTDFSDQASCKARGAGAS